MVYAFTGMSGMSQNVTVDLTGLSDDLDLMVMTSNGGGCDPGLYCGNDYSAHQGSQSESVSFTITPGATYYIVVDGYDGATSSYTLDVSCN